MPHLSLQPATMRRFVFVLILAIIAVPITLVSARRMGRPGSETGAGFEAQSTWIRQIPLVSNDLVYSQSTHKLYLSVPSAAGANGNTIAALDPVTEASEAPVFIGSEPRAAFGKNQPFPNPNPNPQFPNEEKKLPSYAAFAPDRARVRGGSALAQTQLDLANAFVLRPSFLAKYPATLNGTEFVDAVLSTIRDEVGADITSQRQLLIDLFAQGGRGAVMYRLAYDNLQTNPINNRGFIDAEYNRAFVVTQYFGYLRRNPDIAGFVFWLGQVNSAALRDVPKQHAMVCSFITSAEYQQRFNSTVTHNNSECPQ